MGVDFLKNCFQNVAHKACEFLENNIVDPVTRTCSINKYSTGKKDEILSKLRKVL